MFAYGIFKVIYSPYKAFKEIIEKPSYIGPVLIMILFIIANTAFGYALLSKSYFDQTAPSASERDKWTENVTFWISNANITVNTNDYINGTYYGNKSIEFSSDASSYVWMQLNTSASLNCSGSSGYKSLSFRVKWVQPKLNPLNVSLYMISTTVQDFFYKNITNELNWTNSWNNLTIMLGADEGWEHYGSASWANITGLKLEFMWLNKSNVNILIDGLFFHDVYKSGIESGGLSLLSLGNPYSLINSFMQFTIQWVILGGVLYIIPKVFGVNTVWKPLLTIAGFVLITYCIRMVLFTGVFAASPGINYPLKYLGGVPGEWETAYTQVFQSISTFYQVMWWIDKVVLVWAIVLCAIALRLMFEISWLKSVILSASSYLLYILILVFLTPIPPLLL